jgi:hypothetical protein
LMLIGGSRWWGETEKRGGRSFKGFASGSPSLSLTATDKGKQKGGAGYSAEGKGRGWQGVASSPWSICKREKGEERSLGLFG